MHARLIEITKELTRNSEQLLRHYHPDLVHDLRVCIRRIRGILKQLEGPPARDYRRAWGGFAALTNDARDWDVFFHDAHEQLDNGDFAEFESLHGERLRASRQAVLDMLHSASWREHQDSWREFIASAAEEERPGPVPEALLERALAKAAVRLEKALRRDSDRDWHKLRIAVKNVRYIAESMGDQGPGGYDLKPLITECVVLQKLLGHWHDAITQLDLLDGLGDFAVHSRLRAALEVRKGKLMAEARSRLARNDILNIAKKPIGSEER